jgi:hypothetical protein
MKMLNSRSVVWILSLLSALCGTGLLGHTAPARAVDPQDSQLQDRINDAIERLASKQFDIRQLATKQLKRVGASAIPALEQAAKSNDRETRTRSLDVLRTLLRGPDSDAADLASGTLKRLAADRSHASGRLAATILENRVEKLRVVLDQRALVLKQLQGGRGVMFPQRIAFRPPVFVPRPIGRPANATITVSDNRHGRLRVQVVNGNIKLLEVQDPNGKKKTYSDLKKVKAAHPQLFGRYEAIARRNNYPLPK